MTKGLTEPLVGAFIFALLFVANAGHAADIKQRTLRFAFVQPKDHPWGYGAQRFADLVSEKSGKKITVKTYPSGTLGGDIQMLSSLQGGTLDITMMSAGLLVGLKPEFVVWDLPFLFNDFKETDAVLDGPIGKKLMDTLPEKGLIGLGYWDHGFRNVTNSRRPIAKVEDIEGLKIRTLQAPIQIDIFNTLGANAVPLSFPELYSALESKGMVVNDISPQEKARMREKLKPVTDKYSKEAGEALVKEVNAEIEKVRASQ